jgi:hypothetical protein
MNVLVGGSAWSRRMIVGVGLAAVVSAAPALAQQPAAGGGAQAPAESQAPPPAEADPFKFTSEAGYFQFLVKGDKAADFESVWDVIYQRLNGSDKPELKELGTSLKMYRLNQAPGAAPGGQVTYLFLADPASKTHSYSVSPFILFQSGLFQDAEGRELFGKISEALDGYGTQELKKLH